MQLADSGFGGKRLLERLGRFPTPGRYLAGFSGGADSTALLQSLCEIRESLPAPLEAVHFNHGLQDGSDGWQAHCVAFCRAASLPCHVVALDIEQRPGSSPEEAARDARYRAVETLLDDNELYLTAHHADDQAETLFLNLMRGSGIDGLAGIPELRSLGRGWVARPLLDVGRQALEGYLRERGIAWLEDPSNRDTSFDRSYLRHELFPLLEQRWPGVANRLGRTARNTRTGAGALADLIEARWGDLLQDRVCMQVTGLLACGSDMRSLVLRQWLRKHEAPALPEARLREFLAQLGSASSEKHVEVQWAGWMLKRYRDNLWLQRHMPDPACPDTAWNGGMRLDLGRRCGRYTLDGPRASIPRGWRAGPRREGGTIRLAETGPSQALKKRFQSWGIPPWLRLGIPVLYWDDEAVAVGDWAIAQRLSDWLKKNGLELTWKPADPVLARVRENCQTSNTNP